MTFCSRLHRGLNWLAEVTFGDMPSLTEAALRALGRPAQLPRPAPTTFRIDDPAIGHHIWVAMNNKEGVPMGTRLRPWWRRNF